VTNRPTGLVSLADLSTSILRPPPSLIDGLLLDRTLTQISAPPAVGKSLLMQAMMISLDTQVPLMSKFPIPKRKSTLYLAFDARPWDYVQQTAKLIRGLGLGKDEWSRMQSYFKFKDPKWKLTSPAIQQHLKAWHGDLGYGVLMLDTFRRFHQLNQNDDRDMASFMEVLIGLCDDLKIALIFSNHERKPTEGSRGADANYSARGSTEIPAAVDFNLVLHKRGKGVRLHLPKGRGAAPDDLDHTDFTITYGGTPEAPAVTLVPVDASGQTHQAIVSQLVEGFHLGNFSRAQLVETLAQAGHQRPERIADTGIAWLHRNKRITSTGRGTWRLT